MAHHASAKKRIRQTRRATIVNRMRLTALRSQIRKVEEAIAKGDRALAQAALKDAQPVLQRGAQKGVVHAATARRKLSRLSQRIKKMAA